MSFSALNLMFLVGRQELGKRIQRVKSSATTVPKSLLSGLA